VERDRPTSIGKEGSDDQGRTDVWYDHCLLGAGACRVVQGKSFRVGLRGGHLLGSWDLRDGRGKVSPCTTEIQLAKPTGI